jgi:hypothetical protein
MSLKLMICPTLEFAGARGRCWCAHILVSKMLEKLQLAVCALRQHRSAEWLHDLLDGHGLAGELILGRAALSSVCGSVYIAGQTYQTRPKAPMPTGCRSVYLCDVSSSHHRNVGYCRTCS